MFIMVLHLAFAGVLILEKDVHPWFRWIFELSFIKHANDGLIHAILGYNRTDLQCEEIYCHFQKPDVFLQMIGAPQNPAKFLFICPLVCLVFHVLAFINMRRRLEESNKKN